MFNLNLLVLVSVNTISVCFCVKWHQRSQSLIPNYMYIIPMDDDSHLESARKFTTMMSQHPHDKLKEFNSMNPEREIPGTRLSLKSKRLKRSIVINQAIDEDDRAKSVVSRLIGTDNSEISVQYEHEHQQSNEKMYDSKVDELAFLQLNNIDLGSKFQQKEYKKFKDRYGKCHELWRADNLSTGVSGQFDKFSSKEALPLLSKRNIFRKLKKSSRENREPLTKNEVNVNDQISVGKDGQLITDRKFAKGESQTNTNIDLTFLNTNSKFSHSQANQAVIQLRVPNISGKSDETNSKMVDSSSSGVERDKSFNQASPKQICSRFLGPARVSERNRQKLDEQGQPKPRDGKIHFGSQVKIGKSGFLEDLGLLTSDQAQLSEFSQDFNGEEHNSFSQSEVSLTRIALSVSSSFG